MNIKETSLKDALIIEPTLFEDKRGYFYESFNYDKLNKYIGHFNIFQINKSRSKYGVLRGLHFQDPPYNQAKIITVIKGAILDVIVDIRTDSPTYGKHESFLLKGHDKRQLYIPRGFAHGFIVLSRNAEFQYIVDNKYAPEHDNGIKYNDVFLNINWEVQNPILSDKDKNLKPFIDVEFHSSSEYSR